MAFLDNILEASKPQFSNRSNRSKKGMTTHEYNLTEMHKQQVTMMRDIAKDKRHSTQKTLRHAKSFQIDNNQMKRQRSGSVRHFQSNKVLGGG